MKQLFTTLLLALGAAVTMQAAEKLYLEAIESQQNFDNLNFFYDTQDRLSAYTENEDWGGTEKGQFAYTFSYNNQGEQTEMMGYQKLEGSTGSNFVNTMKYYFTYTGQGKVYEQKNFNLDLNGGFKIGGIYRYVYNEDGTIGKRYLYYDESYTQLREITRYDYDAKGLLESSTTYSTWDTEDNAEPESQTQYAYDEQGRMAYRVGNIWNGHEFVYSLTEEFTYDERGNLTERLQYRSSRDNATEKDVYAYGQVLAKDVVLPVYVGSNFDDNFNDYVMSHSPYVIDVHTAYKVSYQTEQLDVFDVSTYAYASERPEYSSVAETLSDTCGATAYYNLQGQKVDNPQGGIFIKCQGSKATKVLL